jgi:hypothetical protein
MRTSILLTLCSTLFASAPAFATEFITKTATGSAIACVPMSTTSTVPPWEQTHGKVYHRGSATENIVLFCHVAMESIDIVTDAGPGGAISWPKVMTIKYVDPDASGRGSSILAELKYADDAGNMIEMAVADSNAQGAGTGIRTMDADISGFSEKELTFTKGHLYVQLTIKRTTTGLLPAVYGYTLH